MDQNGKQTLILKNRESLTIDGVDDVLAFSEEYLELSSNLGTIFVEGEGLKIEELSRETSVVSIKGHISGVFYKEGKAEKGFFARFFK